MRGFLVRWRYQKNISFFELTMTGTSSTVAAKTLRFLYAPPPESHLSVQNLLFATPRTFSIYAAMVYYESHLRVLPCHLCRSCVLVCGRNSLLAFNALLWYYLLSVLRNHKTFLMSARLSRRFSCMVRLRLLLLHTVRMTWRLFPRFLIRGYLREYLCRQSCLQHD